MSLINQNNNSAAPNTSIVGQRGEKLAAEYLIREGYNLVLANFKMPVGRNRRGAIVTSEIDLVAFEKETLCFVEVKTRSSDEFASPLSAVNRRKQRQITRAARIYRRMFRMNKTRFRYDVVSIVLNNDARPKIELIRGFWTEDIFKKRVWSDDFY